VKEARRILDMINPDTAETALISIRASDKSEKAGLGEFLSRNYRFPILLAFLIAFFNQMSGINAVLYFAPRIFIPRRASARKMPMVTLVLPEPERGAPMMMPRAVIAVSRATRRCGR
jgi:hypothetical protein